MRLNTDLEVRVLFTRAVIPSAKLMDLSDKTLLYEQPAHHSVAWAMMPSELSMLASHAVIISFLFQYEVYEVRDVPVPCDDCVSCT